MKTGGVLLFFALAIPRLAAAQSEPTDAFIARQAQSFSPGSSQAAPIMRSANPRTDWFAPFEAGKCYVLSGAGGAGVRRLSFFVWDPSGRRVADSKPHAPWATLSYCAQWTG